MVKVVDISLVADKSLDIYCESLPDNATESSERTSKYRPRSVSPSVMKIFQSVFDSAASEYSRKFDRVFFVVTCFPLMRMRQPSIINRFVCKDGGMLADMGVSSNQFQEMFEKFIVQKCRNEYLTIDAAYNNCFVLNGRGVLLDDWVDAIVDVYGTSLTDLSVSPPFDSNPGFIGTIEYNTKNFTETTEETKFKLRELLKNLT